MASLHGENANLRVEQLSATASSFFKDYYNNHRVMQPHLTIICIPFPKSSSVSLFPHTGTVSLTLPKYVMLCTVVGPEFAGRRSLSEVRSSTSSLQQRTGVSNRSDKLLKLRYKSVFNDCLSSALAQQGQLISYLSVWHGLQIEDGNKTEILPGRA